MAPNQLHMLWPVSRLTDPPMAGCHRDYALRLLRRGDEPAHTRVMLAAGFAGWGPDRLEKMLPVASITKLPARALSDASPRVSSPALP